MELRSWTAEVFIPHGGPAEEALGRTTHLAVGAHQDDLEIMAYHGILQCFGSSDKWFAGITVTNGAGSPRDDLYVDYTGEEMQKVRNAEQKKAAALLGIFDSQICGGKRYYLATVGRRRANATYYASHGTDVTTSMIYAMDLTALVRDAALDVQEYVADHIRRFADDVSARIGKSR